MIRAPWVVAVSPVQFRCDRCGVTAEVQLPCKLSDLASSSDEFIKVHQRCPSEHDYLKQRVFERYCDGQENRMGPLQDEVRSLFQQRRRVEAIAKEREAQALQQQLAEERWRGEEIVHWLEWDERIRQETGSTYPDVYEGAKEARSVSAKDF